MSQRQSRLHRRWIGSHALIGLIVLADLVGAGLTYLAGGLLLPALWTLLVWAGRVLELVLGHLLLALHPDLVLVVCLGVGALIGLLLAFGFGGMFTDSYSTYRGSIDKALLAFVCTLAAALFCWVLLALLLHPAPIFWPPAPVFAHTLTVWSAWLWLFYYLIMHSLYIISAPHQLLALRGQCLYRYTLALSSDKLTQDRSLVLADQRSLGVAPSFQKSVPVSRAHPGGPKWNHMERCYEQFRTALTRFDPPPFALKTPDGFHYYEGGGQQMYWYKHTLLIPKDFLEHEWRHALLPELGRQLRYLNSPDLFVFELLNSYPRKAVVTLRLLATMNFLWLPTVIKNIAGERWQGERVLDDDLFAYKVGEGMRLRARLKVEQEANIQAGLVGATFPTLDERLEHLNAYINEEAKQLRALGYTWNPSQQSPLRLAGEHLLPPAPDATLKHAP